MCAWDLEEPESRHPEEQLTGGSVFTRRPSYTTEYLADVATTAAPIVSIATTPKSKPAGQRRLHQPPCNRLTHSRHPHSHPTMLHGLVLSSRRTRSRGITFTHVCPRAVL